MFVRNLDYDPSIEELERDYKGLRIKGRYLLPYFCKYVAWFIVVASILSSSVVLGLYGLTFGMIKSYLWLTGFASSFLVSLFLVSPIRIVIMAFIKAVFMKRKPVVLSRRVNVSLISNPEDEKKKEKVLKFRECNAHLYNPIPPFKLKKRFEVVKYNIELQNLLVQVVFYFVFMLISCSIVLISKTTMKFYTNDIITEVFLEGAHSHSITFQEVDNYKKLMEYLNETLLPALFTDEKNKSTGKGSKDVFDRGWVRSLEFKLLGRPRFRQVRVQKQSCKQLLNLEGRDNECAAELNLFNVERKDFTLNWEDYRLHGLVESQFSPWIYQSAWKTRSLPVFAKFSSYPPGGYVLDLARNLDDARIVLDFMEKFEWLDMRTRVLFIDFTLYCVNTNLFSIVTLIAERPANGFIIPSSQIETCKFTFLEGEIEILSVMMSVLLLILLFVIVLRESLMIYRSSFKVYLNRNFASLDLFIIFLGFLSMIFIVLRSSYVSELLKELEAAENNKFVSFDYAACWHTWSIYIEGILVCLAPFKLCSLLAFKVSFFHVHKTLSQCYNKLFALYIQQFVLIIAFAFFFNIVLVTYAEGFSTFGLSLSTMIGRSVSLDDSFDFSVFTSNSWFVAPLFFGLFVVLIPILFVNIFIAVVCIYFSRIRNTIFIYDYDMFEFLKHYLTLNRQSDIFPMKPLTKAFKKKNDVNLMRLKGGGNRLAKRKYCKKIVIKPKPKRLTVKLEDFWTMKLCDMTEYTDLEKDREEALKTFMLMLLTKDEEWRKNLNEKSLMSLYYSFTAESHSEQPGDYFILGDESAPQVYNKAIFKKIKKEIEDFGRKTKIIEEETIGEDIILWENKLSILEQRLNILCKRIINK